jgi:protein TorT
MQMKTMALSTAFGATLLAATLSARAEDWTVPLYGENDNQTLTYTPLPAHSVSKKWHLCVALPHMKDAYYIAKDYGAVAEAQRQGVEMTVMAANGYSDVQGQINQIENCVSAGGNAVLVNAVSTKGLVPLVEELHQKGIPVIDMGNGLETDLVAARAKAAYEIAGYTAGKYLADHHPKGSGKFNLIWLAGPAGAQWVEDAAKGMKRAIDGSDVEVLKVIYGDSGKSVQMNLLDNAIQTYPNINVIGGIGPAIEGGMDIVQQKGLQNVQLIAFYITPTVEQAVRDAKVTATVCDYNAMGARISVDQALRILEKKEYTQIARRKFFIVDKDNVNTYDRATCLAPTDFQPSFKVGS